MRNDNFDELKLVDRTTAKFKVDVDKRTYGKRAVKRRYILGVGIHNAREFLYVFPVA